MQDLFTPEQLAKRWNTTHGTLAQWRFHGGGPMFVKLGHKILYRKEDVVKYEKSNRKDSTPRRKRQTK